MLVVVVASCCLFWEELSEREREREMKKVKLESKEAMNEDHGKKQRSMLPDNKNFCDFF